MAASLRGMSKSFMRHTSHPNLYISPAQLLFPRGFASKLLVKGIPFTTTEESLAEAFSRFGKVLVADIMRKKQTNKSKGYGFVTFEKEEAAQKALMEMNGKLLDNRVIFVDNAWPSSYKRAKSEGGD